MPNPTLFSTQIFHQNLIPKTLQKELLREVDIYVSKDDQGHEWSEKNYPNGYTSFGSLDRLQYSSSSFEELSGIILKTSKNYLNRLDYKTQGLHMMDMWINVMPEGAHHSWHVHPKAAVSGTVYLQTPKNCSAIKFEDPRLSLMMNSPYQKEKIKAKNSRYFQISPQAGDLVLFESWLRHEVPMNQTETPRISVSFNLDC